MIYYKLLTFFILLYLSNCEAMAQQKDLVSLVGERQGLFKDIEVHIHVKSFIAKGSHRMTAAAGKNPAPFPEEDTTLEFDDIILIKNNMLRHESNQPIPSDKTHKYHVSPEMSVVNPKGTTLIYPIGVQDEPGMGVRKEGSFLPPLKAEYLFPLMMYLRGLDANVCPYDIKRYKPTLKTLSFDGRECEEYIVELESGAVFHYYFDMKAGGILRHMTEYKDDRLIKRTDIHYNDNGYISSWVHNDIKNGNTTLTHNVTVTTFNISANNPDDKFYLDFPTNCYVVDEVENIEYKIDMNGNKHYIRGRVQTTTEKKYQLYIIYVLVGMCILAIVYWLVIRKKKTKTEPSNPLT